MAETVEEKFVRLATKRVNNALDKLRLLGNLANYKYSDEQSRKIIATLRSAVDELEQKLSKRAKKDGEKFSL